MNPVDATVAHGESLLDTAGYTSLVLGASASWKTMLEDAGEGGQKVLEVLRTQGIESRAYGGEQTQEAALESMKAALKVVLATGVANAVVGRQLAEAYAQPDRKAELGMLWNAHWKETGDMLGLSATAGAATNAPAVPPHQLTSDLLLKYGSLLPEYSADGMDVDQSSWPDLKAGRMADLPEVVWPWMSSKMNFGVRVLPVPSQWLAFYTLKGLVGRTKELELRQILGKEYPEGATAWLHAGWKPNWELDNGEGNLLRWVQRLVLCATYQIAVLFTLERVLAEFDAWHKSRAPPGLPAPGQARPAAHWFTVDYSSCDTLVDEFYRTARFPRAEPRWSLHPLGAGGRKRGRSAGSRNSGRENSAPRERSGGSGRRNASSENAATGPPPATMASVRAALEMHRDAIEKADLRRKARLPALTWEESVERAAQGNCLICFEPGHRAGTSGCPAWKAARADTGELWKVVKKAFFTLKLQQDK